MCVKQGLGKWVLYYIWQKKKTSLPEATIYLSLSLAGLGVPQFLRYDQGEQTALLTNYYAVNELHLQVRIEASDCSLQLIDNLLWLPSSFQKQLSNPDFSTLSEALGYSETARENDVSYLPSPVRFS